MKTGRELIAEMNATRPEPGKIAFWRLGQMGVAVKCGETILYLDAFLSPYAPRMYPSILEPEEITNADLIFGSHDHTDHIDRKAWPILAKASPDAAFAVPSPLTETMPGELGIPASRFLALNDGETFRFKDVEITGIAAAHEFPDTDANGRYLYSGILISYGGRTIYHSGDCCIYEGMYARLRKYAPYALFCLPVNGRDAERYLRGCIGNMTYQEAADLTGAFRPEAVLPGHFDMIRGNLLDVNLFTKYLNAKYPDIPALLPQYGERVIL